MKAPTCNGCGLPVLALAGQYDMLQAYAIDDHPDRPPASSADDWHRRCLAESPHGAAWARLWRRSYAMRGYGTLHRAPGLNAR